jgi:TolA-binding protein
MALRIHVSLIFLLLAFPPGASAQDTKENADFKLAVSLYNDKLYDLALEQFRQFVDAYPNTQQGMEARFYLGLTQMKMAKYDDARLTFQNFALAFPDHPKAPEAWWNVAEAYVATNNAREAAIAFERVKTFQPKSKIAPAALMKSSEYFMRANDPEDAKRVLRALVQDYGSSDVVLPARLKLAEMYLPDNQFELARAEAKRVVDGSKDPAQKAEASITMAKALAGLGKDEEAESALTDLIKSNRSTGNTAAALLFLGSLQRDAGRVSDAMSSWQSVADDTVRADSAVRQDALLELGDAYLVKGEYNEALTRYEKAEDLKGARAGEASYKSGICAEQTGLLASASDDMKSALADTSRRIDPRTVLMAAARIAAEAKDYQKSVNFSLAFYDRYRNDPHAASVLLDGANVSRDHLQDYHQAVNLYETVLREFPASEYADDAMFGYAEALRLSGQPDLALQTYEALETRYPASEFVGPARKAVEEVRTFQLKDEKQGLEKLALLIGNVIAGESKGELAYGLAEFYFEDLKNYDRAAAQFQVALQAGLSESRQMSAWYHEAQSYEYLARHADAGGGTTGPGMASRAIAAYDSLLQKFPANEFLNDAVIAQLRLKLQLAATVSDVRSIGVEFLKNYPTFGRRDLLHFALGEAYRRLGANEDAEMLYGWVLQDQPPSGVAAEALYRLGEVLYALGSQDTASVVLNDYLSKYPNHQFSARAAWTLAQYYAGKGESAQAIELYDRIDRSYAYTAFSRNLDEARGDAYAAAGESAQAIESYQRVLRSTGDDPVARARIPKELFFNLALCYGKTGDRSAAKRYYGQYLLRDDTSERAGQAYYALAQIARDENNVSLATEYFQAASRFTTRTEGGVNRAEFDAAELYFKNEEYAKAIAGYNALLQEAKDDTLQEYLQSRVVVSYFRLNNTKEADTRAAAFVRKYRTAGQYAAEFEYERGMYFLRKNDPTNAKRFFDAVIKRYASSPFVARSLYGNARVEEIIGNTQEAIRLYGSLLLRYPNDKIAPRAQLSLGNLYYNKEQWDSAAREYKAIVDSESRAPDLVQYAMNNLIMTYKQLSLFDAALELTRQYIDRYPDDPDLMDKRVDIGVLYQRLGYYDQSVVHLRSLLENADPDVEAEVRYYIGESYFYKGDYQQAILEFLKVPYLITKRTKNDWASTSYYMAGQAYEKMSKFDQAITMYKMILQRPGVDATFRTGAQREIDRVNALVKNQK